jgi:quercetin dioxygenase-like cupin family protein
MATQVTENTKGEESIGFARGRQSLDRSIWYGGSLMTFLATGEDTQGKYSLIEAVTREGSVAPRHIHHREDEAFYVLEGEISVSIGDRTIKATSGSMVFLPRGVEHCFVVESEQVRMLVLFAPAGMEGWFKELGVPAPAMTLPPTAEVPKSTIQRMLEVSPQYGIEFVAPKTR